jgi:hypothetical protein
MKSRTERDHRYNVSEKGWARNDRYNATQKGRGRWNRYTRIRAAERYEDWSFAGISGGRFLGSKCKSLIRCHHSYH